MVQWFNILGWFWVPKQKKIFPTQQKMLNYLKKKKKIYDKCIKPAKKALKI